MRARRIAIVIIFFVVLLSHVPVGGITVYPNDDVTLRGSTNYNATSVFGLFVKNSSDVSYLEFDFGSVAAAQVILTLHNDDTGVSNPWEIVVRGAEFDFDETTFTGTNVGGWTRVGTIPGVRAVAFYSLDLTDFYNANLGKRITLHLGRDVQPSGSGPIFEDREGTKTGDALTYGPRIDVLAPAKALNPEPFDGQLTVPLDQKLSWSGDSAAVSHEVYFGTTNPPPAAGDSLSAEYDPGLLEFETAYYWRVDEVTNGGTVTGDMWRFITAVEGDTEPDGDVDWEDVSGFADYWLEGGCYEGDRWCGFADIDFGGAVDGVDLGGLAMNWLYHVVPFAGQAGAPGPADGAAQVNISSSISWSAGEGAKSHDVYFGTTNPPEYRGRQGSTVYYPGIMAAGTSYYWRIDEVNRTGVTEGTVWSFTTEAANRDHEIVFPGTTWQSKSPQELGLDGARLDEFAARVGGVGCIVRQGYVVKTWGGQSVKADWASAAKPVISTMLFFAIEEGLLNGVHDLIQDHGWDLIGKDESMEFYHLANMISGYTRGEGPGEAWAYNDYAISLYARTLFNNVYGTTPDAATTAAGRLGSLQFEDGSIFSSRGGYGLSTSVRDFARIGWLWCNYGYWNGQQLLPRWYFDEYMKAHVPASLPRTTTSDSDYLGVGTYGGGSDQTADGPGVYGFNWWCNPDRINWPDAPADTVQANGHWGQEVVTVIPSRSLVVACRGGMGSHATGSSSSAMNQNLKLLVDACPPSTVGQIVADIAHAGRMVYHGRYEEGRERPVCFAGPGDPEDFFYNDTEDNLNLLRDRGARCTYITAVLKDFGGGEPGAGVELDARLDEWEDYISQLEEGGVITVLFFFDDSQPLTDNWEELVDLCVAKFKHHKLLIWSVAEEYGEALSKAEVSAVAARIKAQDNFNHLVGVHQNSGSDFDFMSDANVDMFLMQLNGLTPDGLHDAVKNSNANGAKILNLAEVAGGSQQSRQTLRLLNWAAVMGGASAVQVLWMGRASDPADWNDPDKYDDCARLMDFMESIRLNETVSHDELARGDTDYVLANPGQVYIGYADSGSSPGLSVEAGDYRIEWFDCADGDWVDQGTQVLTAGDHFLTKPAGIGPEAVLYMELQ